MSYSFNMRHGLILVRAELFGPFGNIVLRLALDTGATGTIQSMQAYLVKRSNRYRTGAVATGSWNQLILGPVFLFIEYGIVASTTPSGLTTWGPRSAPGSVRRVCATL